MEKAIIAAAMRRGAAGEYGVRNLLIYIIFNRLFKVAAAALLVAAVAGCTPAPTPVGFQDPDEAQNRKVHALNKGVDRRVLRPVSAAYGASVPQPARKALSNFSENLSLPGVVVNNLLQFRIEEAGANTFRFLLNSTFGLGGLVDVATEAGIAEDSSDFGETLYVWGVGEGQYVEVPLLGPSTSRALAGRIVDTVTNPLTLLSTDGLRAAGRAAGAASVLETRSASGELIDQVLYDSADSYAQTRLVYLQNRRFRLSGEAQIDDFDPYEDFDDAQ